MELTINPTWLKLRSLGYVPRIERPRRVALPVLFANGHGGMRSLANGFHAHYFKSDSDYKRDCSERLTKIDGNSEILFCIQF